MPNPSKEKGDRFEREIVHKAEAIGLAAYRHFLSRSPLNDAVDIVVAGNQVQCKKEAKGFKRIRAWMEGVDAVVVGSDNHPPLVILKLDDWLKLL